MAYHAYGFVDGGYLRKKASDYSQPLLDPQAIVKRLVHLPKVQSWCGEPTIIRNVALARVIYYDARPDDDSDINSDLKEYWDAIELLPDTDLGFGSLRGGVKKRPPRQKGVDTLIAVDMLVGAFTKLYSIAILLAGDADFVPVVYEVRRQGVMVVVAGWDNSMSDDLRRSADRYISLEPMPDTAALPPLIVNGKSWPSN
jgi:uncharacterized LabA/DUF88 family protein